MFLRTTKFTSDSRMHANWDRADHSLLLMSNLGRWNATTKIVSAFLDHRGYFLIIVFPASRHAVNARLDSIPCPWWVIHLPILCTSLGNNAYPQEVRWRRATTTYLSNRRLCSCLEDTGVRATLSGSKIVADDSLRSFSEQKLDRTSFRGAPTEIDNLTPELRQLLRDFPLHHRPGDLGVSLRQRKKEGRAPVIPQRGRQPQPKPNQTHYTRMTLDQEWNVSRPQHNKYWPEHRNART